MLAGLLLLPLLWTQMSREQKSAHHGPIGSAGAGPSASDDAYHLHQAKRVGALGGVWGSFSPASPPTTSAVYRLPEARSDFIFCVLGERFGLPGWFWCSVFSRLLVWRAVGHRRRNPRPFGRLLAAGLPRCLPSRC